MPSSPFIIPAEAHNAAIGQSDARWARMVASRLGPRSLVFWWCRRLRGRCHAGSWARGRLGCALRDQLRCGLRSRLRCGLRSRLRCQLRGRLSALSESARTDGQQSSNKKYRKNQRTHGVLPKLPTPSSFQHHKHLVAQEQTFKAGLRQPASQRRSRSCRTDVAEIKALHLL
jgi:hypothetical protein